VEAQTRVAARLHRQRRLEGATLLQLAEGLARRAGGPKDGLVAEPLGSERRTEVETLSAICRALQGTPRDRRDCQLEQCLHSNRNVGVCEACCLSVFDTRGAML